MYKKILLLLGIILLVGIIFAQMMVSTLHFNNRVKLDGANHRIVVVANPKSINGGTIIIDRTFNVSGTSTTINASIICEIE